MSAQHAKLPPEYRIRLDSDDTYVLEVWGFYDWVWLYDGSSPDDCYAAYERVEEGEPACPTPIH